MDSNGTAPTGVGVDFSRSVGSSRAYADPELRRLASLSPSRTYVEIAATWLQIFVVIGFCLAFDHPIVTVVGALLVGIRQYALLILLHDGSHGLLHPDRQVNDRISLWLLAAPCGSSFVNSRRSHLMHHRYLGDPARDPDFFLYCSDVPSPKRDLAGLARHFTKLILGGQIAHTLLDNSAAGRPEATGGLRKKAKELFPVALVQLAIAAAFAGAGHPFAYAYLWLLPLLTVAVFLNGARVFFDHANPDPQGDAQPPLLVTYLSSPLERVLLAPFDMNHHAEHHLFPYVPHYNLSRLRALLLENPEFAQRIHVRHGYLEYLREHLRRKARG